MILDIGFYDFDSGTNPYSLLLAFKTRKVFDRIHDAYGGFHDKKDNYVLRWIIFIVLWLPGTRKSLGDI